MAGKNPIKTEGVIGDLEGSLARAFALANHSGQFPNGMFPRNITSSALGLGSGRPLDLSDMRECPPEFLYPARAWNGD